MKAFFFGCYDLMGHYMYGAKTYNGQPTIETIRWPGNNPWGLEIDGGLCPGGKTHAGDYSPQGAIQNEGEAMLHHKDGWTALAFWDRTGDTRPNSNSAFLIEGTHDFAKMMELSKKLFPMIFVRLQMKKIEIVEFKPCSPLPDTTTPTSR